MRIINCIQGSDEWKQTRLGKLTASHANTIACNGKGLETLCFEKVAEILTGKPKEAYTNGDMEHGNEFEMEARNAYEIETGEMVQTVGFIEFDDMVGCSPDGLIGNTGLVEIKCPNNLTFTRYLYDRKIDPGYYAQMQMQMMLTDRIWCDYAVYNPNFDQSLVIQRVVSDPLIFDKLETGLTKGKALINQILEKVQ